MSKTDLDEKDIHICGFCKHYDSDNSYCLMRGEYEIYEEDTCDNWEGDDNER